MVNYPDHKKVDKWFSNQEPLKTLKLTFWKSYNITLINPMKIIDSPKW